MDFICLKTNDNLIIIRMAKHTTSLLFGILLLLDVFGQVGAIWCNGWESDDDDCTTTCRSTYGNDKCMYSSSRCCKDSNWYTSTSSYYCCTDYDTNYNTDVVSNAVGWGVGVIVATVLGIIAFFVIISIVICCFCCRRRQQPVVYQHNPTAGQAVTVLNSNQHPMTAMGQPMQQPYTVQGPYPAPGQQYPTSGTQYQPPGIQYQQTGQQYPVPVQQYPPPGQQLSSPGQQYPSSSPGTNQDQPPPDYAEHVLT